MKKFLILLSIVTVVAMAAPFGDKAYAQSGDLCGGTGGNGQIVSVGNNSFTLKLNDGGNKGGGNLIVTLTSRTAIKTSAGPASLSDLKVGDKVTLVGDNNRDGTFSADAVVLCAATSNAAGSATSSEHRIAVRNENPNFDKVNGVIHAATLFLVGSIWLGSCAYLRLKKRKSFVYLLFFTIFYIYLYKVLDYTLLQFQSLLLLQHFLPNLMLNGVESGRALNLIPLITLTLDDVKTSLLNILMMMPFGFGLPFITNYRFKKVVVTGLLFSIGIELLQFITGFMADTTFRIADINDLIFNTIGVVVGFILFVAFIRIYRHVTRNWRMRANPILRYIAERPQVED